MWDPAFAVMKLRDSQFGRKCCIANLLIWATLQMQFVTQRIKLCHSRFYDQFLVKTMSFLVTSTKETKEDSTFIV